MEDWSRGDVIAFAALLIGVIAAGAAIAVIQNKLIRNFLLVILVVASILSSGLIFAYKKNRSNPSPTVVGVTPTQTPSPVMKSVLAPPVTTSPTPIIPTHFNYPAATPEPAPLPTPESIPTRSLPMPTPIPSESGDGHFYWRFYIRNASDWFDTGIPVNYWNNVNIRPADDEVATGMVESKLGNDTFYSNNKFSTDIYLGSIKSVNYQKFRYWYPVAVNFQDTLKVRIHDNSSQGAHLIIHVYSCRHFPTNCNHRNF